MRRSAPMFAMVSFTTSNFPVFTLRSYTKMAFRMIQPMGSSPKSAPYTADIPAIRAGIPYTKIATASADARPSSAAMCAFTWKKASAPSSRMTGIAATSAEMKRLFATGVYICVQIMSGIS
jgi:hypothetical protein